MKPIAKGRTVVYTCSIDRPPGSDVDRAPVESKMLRSIGYDRRTFTLELEFNGGAIYRYFNVPESVYEGLLDAQSKHGFFASSIDGCYQFKRLTD